MGNKYLKSEATYQSPLCCPIYVDTEGILCDSKEGENESFNGWNDYENDGWH